MQFSRASKPRSEADHRRSLSHAAGAPYTPGTVVKGTVCLSCDYGAFIELEEGIEGLVHISEMSWTRRVKHPSKVVVVGDTVEAGRLDIDAKNNRISLGMKQLGRTPYEQLAAKYPPARASRVAFATSLTSVSSLRSKKGIDGLVHYPSDMSCTSASSNRRRCSTRVTKSKRWSSTSTPPTAKSRRSRSESSSSMRIRGRSSRQVQGRQHRPRQVKVLDFGAFVELDKGVEGLVHVSRSLTIASRILARCSSPVRM